MFDLEKYKEFIQKQIQNRVIYYGKDTTEYYLAFLYQFTLTTTEFFVDKHITTISKKFKTIFGKTDKPTSVSYNNWFLFAFGYKYCASCSTIDSVSNFNKENSRWDKLHSLCKSCHRQKTNEFTSDNPDKVKLYCGKWRNNNREHLRNYNKTYRQQRSELDAYRSMMRYCVKKQATPKWLSDIQRTEILKFYKRAKLQTQQLGIPFQVDHIIPIQGSNVCGLHVPWNLQVITAEENQRKSNKILLVDLLF